MTRSGLRRALCLIIGLNAGDLAAQPTGLTYDCRMQGHPSHGFVASRLLLSISDDGRHGVAFDGIINEVHGRPLDVAVRDLGKGRFRYRWQLSNIQARSASNITATFFANLDTRRQRAKISVTIHGFENEPRGSGRCSIFKG